jgi:translation initiation factor IF-2
MQINKVKVYELAKELKVDALKLVDTAQKIGLATVKTSMQALSTEEIKAIKEHFRKQKSSGLKKTPQTVVVATTRVEKKAGTVIRRKLKSDAEVSEPVQETVAEVSAPIQEQEVTSEVVAAEEGVILASDAEALPEAEVTVVAPVVEEKVEEKKGRRLVRSIIKKVGTEEHLASKIGPKMQARTTPKPTPKPATTTQKDASGLDTGPKKIKSVEVSGPEAEKESKRRLLERQDTVFKSHDYLKRELIHSTKKKKAINRPALKTQITTKSDRKRIIEMGEKISVNELAHTMGIKAAQVISKLMNLGVTATINQTIDFDTASLCAAEFQYEIKQKVFKEEEFKSQIDLSPEKLVARAPIVTIMGHVDHGKTSLLDYIRKSNVAQGEAGGITQHIGAYVVSTPKGKITFLDTPGHEAFTAMRARGSKVTDIVVLVVSAVDGVMPQTLESVSHAKAAKVPIIVAVNKTDLPDANPDRIKQTLAGHELNPEEWGGDTLYVNVSAKTGKGVDKLLESIVLQAELLELKANIETLARSIVIESRLDKHKGPLATLLIQHGKLEVGNTIVCGNDFGKVKALADSFGKKINEALPSEPVEVLGFSSVPNVGDEAFVVSDEKTAKDYVSGKLEKQKLSEVVAPKMTLDEMMAIGADTRDELRVILKSDVLGSLEALKETLLKIPQEKVKLKLLHTAPGGITESDVMLAKASSAIILGFNIRPDIKAQKMAESEKITIRTYTIIYDLLEDLKKSLEGLVAVEVKEKVIGRALVRDIFSIPKIGTIAGSAVIDGKVQRGCFLRLLRDNRIIYEGKISSLKRFKEDVKEVTQGYECGIGLENFNDLKQGDQFEAFIKEESRGSL